MPAKKQPAAAKSEVTAEPEVAAAPKVAAKPKPVTRSRQQQAAGLGKATPVPYHPQSGEVVFKRCGFCGDKKPECRKQKKCLKGLL